MKLFLVLAAAGAFGALSASKGPLAEQLTVWLSTGGAVPCSTCEPLLTSYMPPRLPLSDYR